MSSINSKLKLFRILSVLWRSFKTRYRVMLQVTYIYCPSKSWEPEDMRAVFTDF